jgi:hypothetical protein
MAGAQAAPWQLAQSIGPVWYGQDQTKLISLAPSTDLPEGATVVTGEGGRAMLVRGEQTMLVGPNSVVIVPGESEDGFTTVFQRSGQVTFDVDRQKVQHFAVETPYLAAVVKGTNFTVDVDAANAVVSVNRGLVAVSDIATGEQVDTAEGQRASVAGIGAKLQITGEGLLALITPGVARSPLVSPLTAEQLRVIQSKANGTVRADNQSGDRDGSVIAIGAAGGAGTGGGNASGGQGGEGLTQVALENAADVPANILKSRKSNEPAISPMMFAAAAGLMALLAIGLAYVRRNT